MYSIPKGADATNVNSGVTQLFNDGQGFRSIMEYQRFLQTVENDDNFPLSHIDLFLKTKDRSLLIEIGKSRFLARKIKNVIAKSVEPWQPGIVLQILRILRHVPFELSNLIDNDLGHAVKNIKKTAVAVNNKQIVDETTGLIKEWKELQTKQGQSSVKRDCPERSSNSLPATEYKKVRLAIQKDPPPRPKAITDLNFFNSAAGVEQKRFRTIRPIYNVPATTTTANEVPPLAVTKTISTPSSTKKTVTFADNLFEIREYEKNPEEWTNFDNTNEIENDDYGTEQTLYFNIPTVVWYQPLELSFNTDANPSLIIPKHVRTVESTAQDNREKTSLAAIYTSAQHIPPSPGEPDEISDPNIDTRPIPLEDVNNRPVAYGNAVTDYQALHTPTIVTPVVKVEPYTLAQNNYHAPLPQPPSTTTQPEISNDTVEAMLRNNPGIMDSLKKLSFLAAGNTSVIQPTPSYQQPIYNTNNNNNNNMNNDDVNRNNNGFRRNNRGSNRGRGNGGPNRNFSNRLCTFYNSPEGCRNGDNCSFLHNG
ncbi:hypothetical protein BD770DRAFT_385839 [Pilaira anomala]|nr:hypothetical protein BD770DRAFT_385839 [Pilaira anomala]